MFRIAKLGALAMLVCMVGGTDLLTGAETERPGQAAAKEKLLRHIVLYKFKDGLKPADVQEVVDTFSALPGKIKEIAAYECGNNVSPEGKSEGLTHAFVVSFKTEADRDAYLVHPAHKAYVNVVKDRREKVLVFDYWTGE